MPIQLLRPEVSSKIAAGEVIERPASAVKELVENALDAGASRIRIEIRGGGIEYIRITDNGSGIPAEQVELAFKRFATSKLEMAEDLDAVSTLGFRGEALPSIASVARVELRTRTPDSDSGTSIEIEDGEVVSLGTAGAPFGTTITVRQLFRNLPARRRFLSSANAEQTRIHRVVAHYAMAYPEVGFELSPERGRSFSSPGSGELRDAVSAVHGRQVAEAMLEVTPEDSEDAGTSVSGLIGPPSLDRANRNYISLFANRRWVRNRSLSYAIEQVVSRLHGRAKVPDRGGQCQRAVSGSGRKRAPGEGGDQVQAGEQRVQRGAAGRPQDAVRTRSNSRGEPPSRQPAGALRQASGADAEPVGVLADNPI